MLTANNHTTRIVNVSNRIEKHGTERMLAADIKLSMSVSSDVLNDLESGLRESLYRTPARGDQLSLVDKNDSAAYTVLKHPCLEPLRLKQKFPGYELTLRPIGLEDDDDSQDMFLADVELKKFDIEAREGGSCTLTFTASSLVDNDEAAYLLAALVAEDTQLSLTPPSRAASEGDISGDDEDAGEESADEEAAAA
jgi:hypothetical protein